MKRITIILIVFMLVSFHAMAEPKLTVHFPKAFATKMNDEEKAWLNQEAQKAFPQAIDRIAEFVGTDDVKDAFSNFHIFFRDTKITNGHIWGMSYAYKNRSSSNMRPSKQRQSVFIMFTPFVTNLESIENVMVHEMLHVLYELQYTFDDWVAIPNYVQEGISYYGANQTKGYIDAEICGEPINDADLVVESKAYNRLREVSFLFCFERVYGTKARQKVLQEMLSGKNYKKVFESVSGDKWSKIKRKCKEDLTNYIQKRIDESGDFYPVCEAYERAITTDDYAKVQQMANDFIKDHPGTVWEPELDWFIARALQRQGYYDAAIEYYEQIRTGKKADGSFYTWAARRIIACQLLKCDCDSANESRREFERIYPVFWKKHREELDKGFAYHCERMKGTREGMRTYFYENGQKEGEGEYKNDRQIGHWIFWHHNGQKKAEGEFVHGNRNGVWTLWHDNGQKETECEYVDGKREGEIVYWQPDGKKKSEGEYKAGMKTGLWTYWDKNGEKRSEGKYVDGKKDGSWSYWHKPGQLESKGSYQNGIKTGHWEFWHYNGKKKSEGNFVEDFHDGWKDGPWVFWFYNGKKQSEGSFKAGKRQGPWKYWYENGNLKSEGEYKEDKKDGTWKKYYEAGPLEKEEKYVDGVKKKKKK